MKTNTVSEIEKSLLGSEVSRSLWTSDNSVSDEVSFPGSSAGPKS